MPEQPGAAVTEQPGAAGHPAPAFDAVILAGGRATRLGGADKPGLIVGAATLAASVAAAAAAAGARRVILVGPERPELQPLAAHLPGGLVTLREQPPGSGPVPALRCGLAGVREPWTAILAADLPFLLAKHVQALLGAAVAAEAAAGTVGAADFGLAPAEGAVLVDAQGRPQWLAGCWRTDRLRSALRGYAGASLHGLFQPLNPVLRRWECRGGEAEPWLDCDTPADLRRARELRRGAPASMTGGGGHR